MSQNAMIHIGVHWILGSYVNWDCRSQVGWSIWAVSGNYCSGQSEGEVSLRRLKNNFGQRCKTRRAVGLRWHSSSDVLRFAQVDVGKDCGVHPSHHPHLCLSHVARRHKLSSESPTFRPQMFTFRKPRSGTVIALLSTSYHSPQMCTRHTQQWGKCIQMPTEGSFPAVPQLLHSSAAPPARAAAHGLPKGLHHCHKYIRVKANRPDLPKEIW